MPKKLKEALSQLGSPHITTHMENGEMVDGEGLKRKRGRPKKIPQANPEKLLKGLSKRLTKKQKEDEKKAKEPKKEQKKEAIPEIPLSYKHSTPPAIKVDLAPAPKPAPKPSPAPKTPKLSPLKPSKQEEVAESSTPKSGRRSRSQTPSRHLPSVSPRIPKGRVKNSLESIATPEELAKMKRVSLNRPTISPSKTPVGSRKKPGIENLAGSDELKRLERIAEGEKFSKKSQKEKEKGWEAKEQEAMFKEDKAGSQAEDAIATIQKALAEPKESKEETEQKEHKSPPRILVVDEKWGLNPANKEAIASKPYYSGKGRHSPEYRAWLIANPTAPSAIHWFKTTEEGKKALREHNFALPEPKAVGRPKKQAPPAKTPAVLAYEERHTPKPVAEPKSPSTSPSTSAERKAKSASAVKTFIAGEAPATRTTNVLSTARRVTSLLKPPSSAVKAFEERQRAEGHQDPEPPSRIEPVVEDARATRVKALAQGLFENTDMTREEALAMAERDIAEEEARQTAREVRQVEDQRGNKSWEVVKGHTVGSREHFEHLARQYGREKAEREFQNRFNPHPEEGVFGHALFPTPHPTPLTIDEIIARNESSGKGIDFDKIKWGSLTEQMKHHPEMKSLEQFSNHILANPQEFQKRTIKRANFYKNVIQGKGIMDGDSDSGEEDTGFTEIISHNNIMPMMRPVALHPALESSTMTMNPGAYNNIKPLMGALMGEGVSSHIRRTEHMGRTMSHYGDHALHPQMMPMGHYTKHMMKGGAVMPTLGDLLSHGVKHLKDKFGSDPEQAHHLLHTALHTADIPKELHPLAHYGLTNGLKSLLHTMGGSIGGSFWNDLGSTLGHAFAGVGDIAKDTAYKVGDQIKAEAPGLLHQANELYNSPATQMGIAGATTGLNQAGMPEVGYPLKIANMGISNALDAGDNHRDVKGQLSHAYLSPAKRFLSKIGIKGVGIGDDLAKNLAHNTGRLADSGSDYLIRQMDGHGLYAQGGKIGENLASNLASNVGRLADSGSNYLIRQMGEDPATKTGGEVGDGLYAQGRGIRHAKGSPEAKAHMAKLRAMRKKKMKGGALPPPSRSPVTNEVIDGKGLYA